MFGRARNLLASCVILVALIVSACAPSAPMAPAVETKPAAPPAKEATAAKPATEKPAPAVDTSKRGGTLRYALLADVALNPVICADPNCSDAQHFVFDALTRPDPKTLAPSPNLAKSWDVSPDGLTWTFRLRDDVKWHDGQPFTAEDVKFTYEAHLDPNNKSQRRSDFALIDRIDIPDKFTAKFILKGPYAPLPVQMYFRSAQIIPKHILQGKDLTKADDFSKKNPIGTGPFKVKEYVAGDHISLVAFDDYFLGRPNIDSVVLKIVPDANTQVAQIKSGELDLMQLPPTALAAVKDDPNVKVLENTQGQHHILNLNNKSPLFGDKRVRQAMVYGTDRQVLIDNVMLGKASYPVATIPDGVPWAFNAALPKIPYDPAKAKSLLADAGWKSGADGILAKDGQRFQFSITADKNPTRERIATILQQQYKQLGMDVSLDVIDFATFLTKRLDPRAYDTAVFWAATSPDGDQAQYYATGAPTNYTQYSNAEGDKLLAAIKVESDQNKQKQLLFRWQEVFNDDPAGVPLFYAKELMGMNKKLQGVHNIYRLFAFHYISEWYFSK